MYNFLEILLFKSVFKDSGKNKKKQQNSQDWRIFLRMPNKKCKVKKQVPRTVTLSKELTVHYVDIGESLSAYLQADYNIHDPKWIVNDFFIFFNRFKSAFFKCDLTACKQS